MLALRRRQIHCEINVDETRFDFQLGNISNNLGNVSDTEKRNQATKFLQRKDLYQIVRREICFGLIPKTLKRKLKI